MKLMIAIAFVFCLLAFTRAQDDSTQSDTFNPEIVGSDLEVAKSDGEKVSRELEEAPSDLEGEPADEEQQLSDSEEVASNPEEEQSDADEEVPSNAQEKSSEAEVPFDAEEETSDTEENISAAEKGQSDAKEVERPPKPVGWKRPLRPQSHGRHPLYRRFPRPHLNEDQSAGNASPENDSPQRFPPRRPVFFDIGLDFGKQNIIRGRQSTTTASY